MSDRNVGYPFIALYLLFWMCVAAGLLVFVTSNTPPTLPVVGFEDEAPTTMRNINATTETESVDADGHNVTYLYAWSKNGTPMPELTEPKVPNSETAKGDVWKVTVTPDDGSMGGSLCSLPWRSCAGDMHATAELTVANSVPKLRLAWLHEDLADEAEDKGEEAPEPPTRRDEVTIVPTGLDSDDDGVAFRYYWFNAAEEPEIETDEEGNEIWPESEFTEASLPANTAKRDEEWVVVVWPTDCSAEGEEEGTFVIVEKTEDMDCGEGNSARKKYYFNN